MVNFRGRWARAPQSSPALPDPKVPLEKEGGCAEEGASAPNRAHSTGHLFPPSGDLLSRKFHGAEGAGVCCVIISLDTKGVF